MCSIDTSYNQRKFDIRAILLKCLKLQIHIYTFL